MTSLASFSNRSNFLSDEIAVTTSGTARVLANLPGKAGGVVKVLLKNSAGEFITYPGMAFTRTAGAQMPLVAGDVLKVQFTDCDGAGIEVDQ